MTSVNVTSVTNTVTVVEGDTTVVTVTTAGPQGATGTVAAANSGTAAAPGISFISDPNTGIYNPSADNLAFSTGGTGRLFIDASGNVTFGVNGSTSIIAGQSITLARYSGTDLHSSWKTSNSSAGLGLYQTIGPASGGDSVERLRATISSASGSYQKGLTWQDDSGNLNLGFNAAQGRFEVGNTTIGTGTFTTAPASGTNIAGPNLIIAGGQSTGTGTGGSILFSTASVGGSGTSVNALTERLRIDGSGRLLVGTSTVSDNNAIVQISKDTSGGTGGSLVIRNGAGNAAGNMAELVFKTSSGFTDGYNAAKIAAIQPTGTAAGELAFYTYGAGTGTERARITSAGLVGIGTSAPTFALDVASAANSSAFRTQVGGTTFFSVANNSNGAIVDFNDNAGALKNRIDARVGLPSYFTAGNVGIGTSAPDNALHVNGNISFGLRDAATSRSIGYTAGSGAFGANSGHISFAGNGTGTNIIYRTWDGNHIWQGNNAVEMMRIDSAGQIEAGSLGTAALPVWSFLADQNTGIYSPGADQLAISTGGTGRLFIRSNGKIYAGGDFGLFGVPGDLNGNFTVVGAPPILSLGFNNTATNTADALLGGIQFGDGDSLRSNYAGISVHNANGAWGVNNSPTYMRFLTCPVSSNTATERLRIDSSGRVGIGTNSPGTILDVVGAGNPLLTLRGSDAAYSGQFNIQAAGGGSSLINATGGNNALAFLTGNSERARIDSSGRLLVGTSSSITTYQTPAFQVHSTSDNLAGASFSCYQNSIYSGNINFGKSRGTSVGSFTAVQSGDQIGGIFFNGTDGTQFIPGAEIRAAVDGTPGTNDMPGRLVFSTTADGAASATERMRIDSAGKVGIGTNSPGSTIDVISASAQLHAGPAAGHGLIVSCTDTTFNRYAVVDNIGFAAGINLYVGNNGEYAGFHIGTTGVQSVRATRSSTPFDFRSAGDITLSSANTERARIDSSGRLLVGTSTARGNFFNTTLTAITQVEGANASDSNQGRFVSQTFGTAGTAGPIYILAKHRSNSIGGNTIVQSGDDLGFISFQGSDGTEFVNAALIFAQVDGTPGANDMPGRLVFSTTADGAASATERMRIDSAGKVGIGTTNVTQTLTVSNSTNYEGILVNGNAAPSICFDNAGNTAIKWRVGLSGSNSTTFCISQAGNTDKLAIDSAGRVLIGTTTANTSGAKLQTSDGITFPATQVASADPNTLDDYEEGTWTPTVAGSSTVGTATYAVQSARYTKIGRVVHFEMYVNWSAGTGTGNLIINGLPFTSSNTQTYPGVNIGFINNVALSANNYATAQVDNNANTVRLKQSPVGGGVATDVAYDADAALTLSGFYTV